MPTAAAVVKEAASHIGYREGRNNDNMFGEFYGANNTAWCAQFVYYAFRHAGAEKNEGIRKTAWCPDLVRDGRNGYQGQSIVRDPVKGDSSGTPRAGDIGLLQRVPGEEGYSVNGAKHVFIVEKYLGDGYVQTIEGNTSNTGSATGNGVYRLKRKLSSRIIIVRPKYKVATTPPPSGGGGGSVKTEVWHIDPAKVSSWLMGRKGNDEFNIVGAPGRNLDIVEFKGGFAITPSGNKFNMTFLKKGKYPGPKVAKVDLSEVILAAKRDPKRPQGETTKSARNSVKIVEGCLMEKGLLPEKYGEDSAFGSTTVDAYAKWQRSLGYSGDDANGVPGRDSLNRLVEPWGYLVVS